MLDDNDSRSIVETELSQLPQGEARVSPLKKWCNALDQSDPIKTLIAGRELAAFAQDADQRGDEDLANRVLAFLREMMETRADVEGCAAAADVLGLWGHEAGISILLKTIDAPSAELRLHTVEALGRIGDLAAVSQLLRVLRNDPHIWVRRHAAQALGLIQDLRAVPDLIEALEEDLYPVQAGAADALGRLPCSASREALRRATKSEHAVVRWHAARALGKIGRGPAVTILEGLRGDRAKIFRRTVAEVARTSLCQVRGRQSELWRRYYRLRRNLMLAMPIILQWIRERRQTMSKAKARIEEQLRRFGDRDE